MIKLSSIKSTMKLTFILEISENLNVLNMWRKTAGLTTKMAIFTRLADSVGFVIKYGSEC